MSYKTLNPKPSQAVVFEHELPWRRESLEDTGDHCVEPGSAGTWEIS